MDRFDLYVCNCALGAHIEKEKSPDGNWVAAETALTLESELSAARAERDALLGWLIFQPHSPLSGGGWEVRGLKTQYLFTTYEAARAALDAALKGEGCGSKGIVPGAEGNGHRRWRTARLGVHRPAPGI